MGRRCTNVCIAPVFVLAIHCYLISCVEAAEKQRNPFAYELSDLAIQRLQIYAWAPFGGRSRPVLLKLWLKRIARAMVQGGPGGLKDQPSFLLPSQQANVVEGIGWAEDVASFDKNRFGKMMMPVDVLKWKPRLKLLLSDGSTVRIQYDRQDMNNTLHVDRRPFFFFFPIPRYNISSCFKVIEETVPDVKMPVCLPTSAASLCHRLAPPDRYTPAKPALWTAMIPFRSFNIPGPKWEEHMVSNANRLHHYISHFRRVGGSGVLLYTNHFTAQGMTPHVQELLQDGSLVFVDWETMEMSHYHYDQSLVYSHAFLGLAACGANLWLQATDVDEYLYDKSRGRLWPEMLSCLRKSTADEQAAVFTLSRFDVEASSLKDGEDTALWSTPSKPGAQHPLDLYDKVATRPMPIEVGKVLACPAFRVVGVWVHFATTVYGRQYIADAHCVLLLHVQKFWVPREYTLKGVVNDFVDLGPSMYGATRRVTTF